MAAGNSGSFTVAGTRNFSAVVYWSETYNSTANSHIVSIDAIKLKSTNWYGFTYFPQGSISVNGETVASFSSTAGSHMLNNKKAQLLPEDEAMDNEIMQKILPRIQGSSASIKDMLCELFKLCAGDFSGYQTESNALGTEMLKYVRKNTCKYRKSAEKIAYMVRRFEEDGFTAYWL